MGDICMGSFKEVKPVEVDAWIDECQGPPSPTPLAMRKWKAAHPEPSFWEELGTIVKCINRDWRK